MEICCFYFGRFYRFFFCKRAKNIRKILPNFDEDLLKNTIVFSIAVEADKTFFSVINVRLNFERR